jgi:hypothetical protein
MVGLSNPHVNPHMLVIAAASFITISGCEQGHADLLKNATIASCNLDASIDAR